MAELDNNNQSPEVEVRKVIEMVTDASTVNEETVQTLPPIEGLEPEHHHIHTLKRAHTNLDSVMIQEDIQDNDKPDPLFTPKEEVKSPEAVPQTRGKS